MSGWMVESTINKEGGRGHDESNNTGRLPSPFVAFCFAEREEKEGDG